MPGSDPREHELLHTAYTAWCQQMLAYLTAGYPGHMAAFLARVQIQRTLGVNLTGYLGGMDLPIPEEDMVFDVRDLSLRYALEHDGSALNTLLAHYDYQWQTSKGEWILTDRARQERAGFLVPLGPQSRPSLLWKPTVVEQVIALEKLRQSLESDVGPNLLQRQYCSPRELGQRTGMSTRRVNQVLAQAGYQCRKPHGRHQRWEPTSKARQAQCAIWGYRGLEWLPPSVESWLK